MRQTSTPLQAGLTTLLNRHREEEKKESVPVAYTVLTRSRKRKLRELPVSSEIQSHRLKRLPQERLEDHKGGSLEERKVKDTRAAAVK